MKAWTHPTPNGRLVFGIFATIAEFERELIRDRVRSGIASARAKGKRLGRPRSDFDISKAQKLRADGCSWRQVAEQLSVPLATLHRTLGGLAVTWRNPKPVAQACD
jgi:putative DNA-invertase from lambdoid prophage Rac